MTDTFDKAFADVQDLVRTFGDKKDYYLSTQGQEQEARQDFLDKFWKALGWDVTHDTQRDPYEQEVKVERGVKVSGVSMTGSVLQSLHNSRRDGSD